MMEQRSRVIGGILVLGIVTGMIYYFWSAGVPDLNVADVDSQNRVASVERMSGPSYIGTWSGSGIQDPQPLKVGDPIRVGTALKVPAGSYVEFTTVGSWLIGLDSDGEFVLEEAKTNATKSEHLIRWTVHKGQLRANPHTYVKERHWMVVQTPQSTVTAEQAEFGVTVDPSGSGRAFVMNGNVKVTTKEGKTRALKLKGVEHI